MAIAISFFFAKQVQAGKLVRIATECHSFDKICHCPWRFTFLDATDVFIY